MTANKEHASEVLPLLSHLEIERTWAGIMPFSKDGKPIIGKLEAMAKLMNNTLHYVSPDTFYYKTNCH